MTVRSVWGRIQHRTATLTSHEGDRWTFDVPEWAASPIVVEIWAEDDAGNVSYRTGVFDIGPGETKCIRWREEGSSLVMLSERSRADCMEWGRPAVEMMAHACSRLVEIGI